MYEFFSIYYVYLVHELSLVALAFACHTHLVEEVLESIENESTFSLHSPALLSLRLCWY